MKSNKTLALTSFIACSLLTVSALQAANSPPRRRRANLMLAPTTHMHGAVLKPMSNWA
jgi:hypothetical protein